MKKLIAIVLCLAMALSMVACGRDSNPVEEISKPQTMDVFQPESKEEPIQEEPTEEENRSIDYSSFEDRLSKLTK